MYNDCIAGFLGKTSGGINPTIVDLSQLQIAKRMSKKYICLYPLALSEVFQKYFSEPPDYKKLLATLLKRPLKDCRHRSPAAFRWLVPLAAQQLVGTRDLNTGYSPKQLCTSEPHVLTLTKESQQSFVILRRITLLQLCKQLQIVHLLLWFNTNLVQAFVVTSDYENIKNNYIQWFACYYSF